MKEGYTWAICSKIIQLEVKMLQTEMSTQVGQNLLGIYLHNSLALGGFQPHYSDINVIVVTGQWIDLETKRLPDEDVAFEALVLERWLGDGGTQGAASDRKDLADADVLNQFH